MINIRKASKSPPYKKFIMMYQQALDNGQKNIEAICISSYSSDKKEVDSRFVNLKYIIDEEWIFFSNYNSIKSKQFESHDQISCAFFWSSTYTQVRLKANIFQTNNLFSDTHYLNRDISKNVIAHVSEQSKTIDSYDEIQKKYNDHMNDNKIKSRPDYWGGYSFKPYYFEFWEGNDQRINKREVFEKSNDNWNKSFLQP